MAGTEKLLKEEVSVAEGILFALEDAEIDMVFGIAGGNMGRLYDALILLIPMPLADAASEPR